jgi:hypothetical protein
MKISSTPAAVVFLMAARALTAADSVLPDFIPAQTRVAIGIRVRSIANSQLGQSIGAQVQALGADWLKAASQAGFDPLQNVDEVLITSTGEGQNAPALIVVRGNFNLDRLGAGAPMYRGVPLLGGGKGSNGVVALLDASTAIAGDAASVRAAIDRRGKGGHMDAALAARIEPLRSRYDIWGIGDRPSGFVPATPTSQGLESVDRFQFGVLMTHGLELAAEFHTRSPQDAKKLEDSLAFFEAMLKAQQPSASQAKVDIHAEGGTLKLSLAISEEELKKAIEQQSAALKRAVARGAGTAAAPAPEVEILPKPAAPGEPAVLNPSGGTGVVMLPGAERR